MSERKIANYAILDRLGTGGMGVVYRARDERLGRDVALKFLPVHLEDDAAARQRFLREARAAAVLEHPNICTIHDIGETDGGELYIVMSLYEGETLQQRLRRGPMAVDDAVDITIQAARGLIEAHRRGIVHRDIKPGNIIITDRGEVKILDFGLASLAGDVQLTKTGSTIGTIPYMSPEQVAGGRVDSRTDLWSLGVVLYAMLTGRAAFGGDTDLAIYRSILEEEPAPPSTNRTDVPDDLDLLVARLLTKDRERRLQSAADVLLLLGASVPESASREATEAFDFSLPAPQRPRPLRKVIPLAAIAAVMIVAGVIAWSLWPQRAPTFDSLAVLPFANYTGNPEIDLAGEAMAAGLVTRLSEVPGLGVVARSEAWRYRDFDGGPVELGRRLGVEVLLEGGVAEGPDGHLVTVSLVETGEGRVLWSQEFAGETDQQFALQQRIADRLVRVMEISTSRRDRRRMAADPTTSFKAYERYLEGRRLFENSDDTVGVMPAIEMYRQAIHLDPEFALAHADLSGALWERARRTGDEVTMGEAEAAARRALDLDPELPAALVAMARILRDTGEYEAAIANLEAVLATHPNPAEAHLELARSYERVGDLPNAEEWYRAATAIASDNWWNWNTFGGFLWTLGRYDDADEAFERAATLAPEGVSTPRENQAAVEISRGNFDGAVAAYEKIKGPVTRAIVASNMGTAYYFSDRPNRLDQAERFYRLAVDLDPRNDEIQRNLADVLLKTGRANEAVDHYRAALEIARDRLGAEPDNVDLLLREAFYSARAGDCARGLDLARILRTELPETAENAHRLAYVYSLCGRRDAAVAALKTAIDQGIAPELLRSEDEFAPLLGDPDFEALVSGAGRGR